MAASGHTDIRQFQPVIGLEIHARMRTRTKAFCGCAIDSAAPPNARVCPICLGHPGTLPVLNQAFVLRTVILGLALSCDIHTISRFARKNYFYPDLPNGYQITQYEDPVCSNGHLAIAGDDGRRRNISIERVHMEEDAGKLMHDSDGRTLIDFNRCGAPLAEVVTAPELRSPAEAVSVVRSLRRLMRHLDLCDGNMEDGSLRCDANISLMLPGSSHTGERTEVKNVNSFRHLEHALAYEHARQAALIDAGGRVVRETRLWDEKSRRTMPMRGKEASADYRYFAEPDLPPLVLRQSWIDELRLTLPELPDARQERLVREYGLTVSESATLLQEKPVADYFECVVAQLRERSASRNRTVCSLINNVLIGLLDDRRIQAHDIPVPASALVRITNLLSSGSLMQSEAGQLIRQSVEGGIAIEPLLDYIATRPRHDTSALLAIVRQVIAGQPGAVQKFLSGKTGAMEYLVGRVLRSAQGGVDPHRVRELLRQEIQRDVV
jgi:aspartyl-tRNA(Asn)/glutamyl-tRNA(Gln) amidotransferase subunit B